MQAEAWIKSKLRDLKDGGNIQCCPLQDWDKSPQILCTDFKDFENRMVRLNQVRQGFSPEMGARVTYIQNDMFIQYLQEYCTSDCKR